MCHLLKGLAAVRERFYQDLADEIAAVQEGNILDVGTGQGRLPIKIAKKNKLLKAYGIDISKKAVDEAQRNALASGLANAPQFDVGDVCALPFEDEFFDLVVSTFSLHHWSDKIGGLNEICRVLKPNGEAWIYDHWKGPSHKAREGLRKDFGLLAAWFALAHLCFVSSPLTMEKARGILQDPKLKFQKRQLEERGIILLMRLKKS
jgi:SAM-dependent methyltransferase